MLSADNERELVRVPTRRLSTIERKAQELEAPPSTGPQKAWEMPRRWRVY